MAEQTADLSLGAMGRWLAGDGSYRRLEISSLAALACLGLLSVADPLWANQATFALFSSELAEGKVLYKEVVDLKQPGVFIYYWLAQLPFGRNAVGIHLVELATWLGFGWVLQRQAASWFATRWLAATLPLVVVGIYFATATYKTQTQVEALINIPMLGAVMLVMPDNDGDISRRRAFIAGLLLAVVAYLKLPYVAIPLVIAIPTLVCQARSNLRRTMSDIVGPAMVGAAILVVPFLVYFAVNDAYSEIKYLYFDYSRERNELWPRPTQRLKDAIKFGAWLYSPFVALGILGLIVDWRAMLHRRTVAMVTWAVVAVPLFLVQQWWTYHVYLWLVPFTLFAWFALDAILVSGRRIRDPLMAIGAVVVLILAMTQLAPEALRKAKRLATNELALTQDGRDELRRQVDSDYDEGQAWSAWNQQIGFDESAWGIGVKPSFLFIAGQEHDLKGLTWPVDLINVEQYQGIAEELVASPPNRFIVSTTAYEDMALRAPQTLRVIEQEFCVAVETDDYNYLLRAEDPLCP